MLCVGTSTRPARSSTRSASSSSWAGSAGRRCGCCVAATHATSAIAGSATTSAASSCSASRSSWPPTSSEPWRCHRVWSRPVRSRSSWRSGSPSASASRWSWRGGGRGAAATTHLRPADRGADVVRHRSIVEWHVGDPGASELAEQFGASARPGCVQRTRSGVGARTIGQHASAGVGRPLDGLDHLQHRDVAEVRGERVPTRRPGLGTHPAATHQWSSHLGHEARRRPHRRGEIGCLAVAVLRGQRPQEADRHIARACHFQPHRPRL